jgi:exonuclease SbcC
MNLHTLRHVGTHAFPREIELDFEQLPTVVAVFGPNGAGKTTLFDLLMAPFVGECPYRPGALHRQFVTKGRIELAWSLGERSYQSILRVDPDAERTEGTLTTSEGQVLAGPLIKDYRRAIAELIGPPELLLAAAYSVQSGVGAFLRLPRAERKALLTELLALHRYPRLEAAAKDRARRSETAAVALRARAADLEGRITQRPALDAQHAQLAARLEDARARVDVTRPTLAEAQQVATAAEADVAALRPAHAQAQAAAAEIAVLTERIAAAESRRQNNEALRARAEEILAAVETDRTLRAELATVDAALEAGRVARDVARAAAQRVALQEKDLEAQRAAHGRLDRAAGLLTTVPCEGRGPYAGCGFLTDARQAAEQLDPLVRRIDAAAAVLEEARVFAPAPDLAPLDARRTAIQKALAGLAAPVALAGPLDAATARLEELGRTIAQATQDREARSVQHAALVQSLAALPGLEERARTAVRAVNTAESTVHEAQQDVTRLERELGQVEGQLAGLREAEAALAVARAELEPVGEDLADWTLLARACSASGIPALLIDQALPELGQLATDLLREAYGEAVFTIALTTQRDSAAGDKRLETLDVVVRRGGTSLDAALLSGGEAVLVSEALSLALALYSASRSGRAIRTLLRDEVSAPLDRDRSPAYVRMLRQAAKLGSFRHVLFVSHQERAIELADAGIEVKNGTVTVQ